MFGDFEQAEGITPTNQASQSNDELLIPIHDDHNHPQSTFSGSQSDKDAPTTHNPPGSLDPTLDLTSVATGCYSNEPTIPNHHLIINEAETILPDVTCVTQSSNFNMSANSYASNQDGENQPLLKRIDSESTQVIKNTFPDDAEFTSFVKEVEQAIENGNMPTRISQGSSGSYFVRNSDASVSVQNIGWWNRKSFNVCTMSLFRKLLGFSSPRMKSPTECWTQSGPNGCTNSAALAALAGPVWCQTKGTCQKQAPGLLIESYSWTLFLRPG